MKIEHIKLNEKYNDCIIERTLKDIDSLEKAKELLQKPFTIDCLYRTGNARYEDYNIIISGGSYNDCLRAYFVKNRQDSYTSSQISFINKEDKERYSKFFYSGDASEYVKCGGDMN